MHTQIHLILTQIQGGDHYYYYPYFTDEKNGSPVRLSNMLGVMGPVREGPWISTRTAWLQSPCTFAQLLEHF